MILDTTYLLPLAQVAINNDILASIARRRIDVKLEDISVSLISIFELQAKSAKLNLPAKPVIRAIDAIISAFQIVPFYEPDIIEISLKTRKIISDYVDCIIISTAGLEKGGPDYRRFPDS